MSFWQKVNSVWMRDKKIILLNLWGLALIVALPFKLLWKIGLVSNDILSANTHPYHLWEIAAIFWSLSFLIVFVLCLPNEFDGCESKAKNIVKAVILIIFAIVLVSCAVIYLLFYAEKHFENSYLPLLRIVAESLIAFVLCMTDLILWFFFKKENSIVVKQRATQFVKYFMSVDGPSLFAFAIIILYLLLQISARTDSSWHLSFISGASALNLILVNVIFSGLEITRDRN